MQIDDFRRRLEFVHRMTLDFAVTVPDDMWHVTPVPRGDQSDGRLGFRPHPEENFASLRPHPVRPDANASGWTDLPNGPQRGGDGYAAIVPKAARTWVAENTGRADPLQIQHLAFEMIWQRHRNQLAGPLHAAQGRARGPQDIRKASVPDSCLAEAGGDDAVEDQRFAQARPGPSRC